MDLTLKRHACKVNHMRENEIPNEDKPNNCQTCKGRGIRKCYGPDHETGERNEYGDHLACDGEGSRMCECQPE